MNSIHLQYLLATLVDAHSSWFYFFYVQFHVVVFPVSHNKDNKSFFFSPNLGFVWMCMMSLSLSQQFSSSTALPSFSSFFRDVDELELAVLQSLN